MSIINCKTSQSKTYLTAKTVGVAEEDMEALSIQGCWMDIFILFFFFVLLTRTSETVDGRLESCLKEVLLPLLHGHYETETRAMSPCCPATRRRDSGVPYTFKGILVHQYTVALNVLLCPT